MRRLAAVAILCVLAGATVQANFLASTGFSGRYGLDCSACHLPSPVVPDAALVVDGVPVEWDYDANYAITIAITGGPPAAPEFLPQGGFEADADRGRFVAAAGAEELATSFGAAGLTYTAEGAMVRSWDVVWQAPTTAGGPSQAAEDAVLWFAAVAANGNHEPTMNLSAGGELLDATDAAFNVIPPSRAAVAVWQDAPLGLPSVEHLRIDVGVGDPAIIRGQANDILVESLSWQIDGGAIEQRAIDGPFELRFENLDRGDHRVQLWTQGADRRSDVRVIDIEVHNWLDEVLMPAPALIWITLALALVARRLR